MAMYLESSFGQWKLPQGPTVIGRGVDCGMRLDDLRLSRHHAEVTLSGNQLSISDLGSTNGVLVDGDPIDGVYPLHHGSDITIGPFVFRVRHAADERDPSRIASEALVKAPAETRHSRSHSDEFAPSTDRALRHTQDMEQRVETPAAKPLTEPSAIRRSDDSGPSAALTERRNDRRLAPVIEQALVVSEDEARRDTPQPGTARKRDTDALVPSQQKPRTRSDALLPIDEGGRPLPDAERSLYLLPLDVVDTSPRNRLIASCGDGLLMVVLAALVVTVGSWLGYWFGGRLTADTSLPEGIWQTLGHWHQNGSPAWWVWLAGTGLGLVAAMIGGIWIVVGGTALNGGPPLHRSLNLVVIHRANGHYPPPWRCVLRLVLATVTAPWALCCLIMGWLPPHDRWSDCRVKARNKAA